MILRRIEGERFSEVLPVWKGRTAVILGGGASLTLEQFKQVEAARAADKIRVVAVNDAYLVAPWADAHYAADSHWHKWHTDGIAKPALALGGAEVKLRWAEFRGQKCTIQNSGANVTDQAVHMLRNRDFPNHGMGLSLEPRYLVTGRNSGFQALNLAVLAGASRIILLGFDGKPGDAGPDHFHGGHPRPTPPSVYPLYRQAMSAAENALDDAGVEVVNCSPGSAIDSFPKRALEELL
jgi:hypothetical protein